MEYLKLEDCCEILDSKRIPVTANKRRNGKYPYYGANGLQDYVDDYIFDDELVLLAEDGGNFNSKDKPIAYRVSGKCWVNNHAHVLKPKQGISVDYLCYALMYYDVSGLVNGATRQKLTQATMRKMKIPILSEIDQLRIVEIMNSIQQLKNDYRSILHKLDVLIKARFIEMFGDPIINSKKLPTKSVINVVTLQRGYDLPNKERHKDGIIPLYGANGQFDWHDTSKACHGIITGRSGSIGQVYYCETEFWPLNTTLFSVDNHGNNIIYLSYLLDFFDLKRFSNGTGVPTLNRNLIHKENIIDVPLISQNQFADFVQQVDKSRFDIKKSITEIEREVVYD